MRERGSVRVRVREREKQREREGEREPGDMCEGNGEGLSLLLAGEKMLALSPAGKQWLHVA